MWQEIQVNRPVCSRDRIPLNKDQIKRKTPREQAKAFDELFEPIKDLLEKNNINHDTQHKKRTTTDIEDNIMYARNILEYINYQKKAVNEQ
ncbi:hypothetical protein DID74_02690 [Candidatus Marinamargulisbacteria bacterium SCGC AG-333-B06]|nr:hypothetical protein DID74_02690 [Candidatus Marinamargulisbacteria bacterium SCGC AG-333-B06]